MLRIREVDEEKLADIIVNACAERWGVYPEHVFSRRKSADVCKARHLAAYVMRHDLGFSYPRIGRALSVRNKNTSRKKMNHATFIIGLRIAERIGNTGTLDSLGIREEVEALADTETLKETGNG